MTAGPGKYDDACTAAREVTGGQVVLIVVGGKHGSGFSVQAEAPMIMLLPEILEEITNQIKEDLKKEGLR